MCASVSTSSYSAHTHMLLANARQEQKKEMTGSLNSPIYQEFVWSEASCGPSPGTGPAGSAGSLDLDVLTFETVENRSPLFVNQPACGNLSKWPKGLRKLSGSVNLLSPLSRRNHMIERHTATLSSYTKWWDWFFTPLSGLSNIACGFNAKVIN